MTYSLFVSADNTGFQESQDPIYNIPEKAIVWVKFSGTNYENIAVTGFDGKITKGTADYYYKIITPTGITKYKVGNNYVLSGSAAISYTLDLSGYSGDAATMQIYAKVYSDQGYFNTYGSYGPSVVELAEQTVTLID